MTKQTSKSFLFRYCEKHKTTEKTRKRFTKGKGAKKSAGDERAFKANCFILRLSGSVIYNVLIMLRLSSHCSTFQKFMMSRKQ